MRRAPSAPPELPGYQYVRHIGGGGFADVFLYEQRILGRKVAVKVLLSSAATPSVRAQFDAESTLMAALSTHPHIVSIYDAAIAADGRPYLIMEYCSRPNLSLRYAGENISVADAVSIGIQIGGAVETAHRAGILHRDIKPANVLTTDYNRPALTDFGISVATGSMPDGDSVGMSIPWSPPEMLSDVPTGDQRADVYSLAATVYTLLARRSPFERPGGPNTAADLVHRIQRAPLPAVGRSDVPPALERALARGLAKDPTMRWPGALQFARALQDIEESQSWPVTQVDVFDENPSQAAASLAPEDDGRTRIRGLVAIHAQAEPTIGRTHDQPPAAGTPARRAAPTASATPAGFAAPILGGSGAPDHTVWRPAASAPDFLHADHLVAPPPADTMMRPAAPDVEPDETAPAPPARKWPWLVVAALAVIAVAVVIVAVLHGGTAAPDLTDHPGTTGETSHEAVDVGVAAPTDLAVKSTPDGLVFTWTDPDPQPGDTFQWQRTDTDGTASSHSVTRPTVTVEDTRACIQVVVVRDNGQFSQPATLCSKGA